MLTRLANSLVVLQQELARWPELAPSYAAPEGYRGRSDHSPWISDAKGQGVYRAIDFSSDHPGLLLAEQIVLRARSGHRALQVGSYVISNRRMASARTGWEWRDYQGKPYLDHVHVSVSRNPNEYDSEVPWLLAELRIPPGQPPESIPFEGTAEEVREIQRRLNARFPSRPPLQLTGQLDSETLDRLICYQKRSQLMADGVLGPKTLAKIMR